MPGTTYVVNTGGEKSNIAGNNYSACCGWNNLADVVSERDSDPAVRDWSVVTA